MKAFRDLYQCEFKISDRDLELMRLVRLYRKECEAYDRTVCTGPIGRDGIMPTNHRELALVNRNARAVRARVFAGTNYTSREIQDADSRLAGESYA